MAPSSLDNIPAHQSVPFGKPGPQILAEERATATFSPEVMSKYLNGDDYLERVNRILPILLAEPKLEKSQAFFLGRPEKFMYGLEKDKILWRLIQKYNWSKEDERVAEHLLDIPSAYVLHKSMFLTTLNIMTTDEQKKLFLEPALRYEIMGCYSQTELGHGSNVQGIETTITYDVKTKSFIVHSPTLTSAKWWSGALGNTSDHSIVMGSLFTPDGPNGSLVNRGPHPILVQIRDLKTRIPLPGIKLGDIGPKYGYAAVDNGTMLLDHVSVPHVNFFAKNSQVDINTGKYTKPPSEKLNYATMTATRAGIIRSAASYMAKASIVAIRYCSIRHQFADKDAVAVNGVEPEETAVINYQMVQARIFPILVNALAFHFTGKDFTSLFVKNEEAMAQGDFSLLADAHAAASGLKSITTLMTVEGIEQARRACGGHGFSHVSGLVSAFQEYVGSITWEGDSYMLTQQVGRYLFKTFATLKKDSKTPISAANKTGTYLRAFLGNPDKVATFTSSSAFSPDFFVEAFGYRAASIVSEAATKREQGASWNSLLVDIYRCSVAHSQFLLVTNFADAIKSDKELAAQPALHKVLTTCFEFFAINTMEQEMAEFAFCGFLSHQQQKIVKLRHRELLAELRPNAVALADGWGVPDFELNSILGRYDGDVYPNIFKFAQAEPLNKMRFNVNPRDTQLLIADGRNQSAKL